MVIKFRVELKSEYENYYICFINEFVPKNDHPSVYHIGKVLPMGNISLAGEQLPVFAYLFTLYDRSIANARIDKRIIFGDKKDFQVPSVGRQRL